MRGQKVLYFLIIAGLVLGGSACRQGVTDSPDKQNLEKAGAEPNAGLIEVIKNGRLANFQSTSIGNAFESYKYFVSKDWKVKQEGSNFVVSFLGWFDPDVLNQEEKKAGVTGKGIDVKFVIETNGSYYVFMILGVESRSDGKVYSAPINDMTGILSSIYAGRKISL